MHTKRNVSFSKVLEVKIWAPKNWEYGSTLKKYLSCKLPSWTLLWKSEKQTARASTSVTGPLQTSPTPPSKRPTITTSTRGRGSFTRTTRAMRGTTSRAITHGTCSVRATSGPLPTRRSVLKVKHAWFLCPTVTPCNVRTNPNVELEVLWKKILTSPSW